MHVTRLVVLGFTVALFYCGCTAEVADRSAESAAPHAAAEALAVDYGEYGWVWANESAATVGKSYTPSLAYQANSRGLTNTVTRGDIGRYNVVLPGLTGGLRGWHGNVQVSAYGSADAHCKVNNFSEPSNSNISVDVRCFDRTANAVNSAFTLLFYTTYPRPAAYAWSSGGPDFDYNSGREDITITKTAPGRYSVTFPGLVSSEAGIAHLTATQSLAALCTAASTSLGATSTTVTVDCFSGLPDGSTADANFMIGYSLDTVPNIDLGEGAYMVSGSVASTINTNMTPTNRFSSVGGSISYVRTAVGVYRARFRGLPPTPSTAVVTAFGRLPSANTPGTARCNVVSWAGDGSNGTNVNIRCRHSRTGNLIDSRFAVTFMHKP